MAEICPTCQVEFVHNDEAFLKSVIAIRNQTIEKQAKEIESLRKKVDAERDYGARMFRLNVRLAAGMSVEPDQQSGRTP